MSAGSATEETATAPASRALPEAAVPALEGAAPHTTGTVLDLVREQVGQRPQALAVVHGDVRLDYAALWERSARLARRLRQAGVGPGQAVGIAARRSPDLITAVVAVLRSGAACLPLDAQYPAARLRFMLDDSGARTVVGHADVLASTVPAGRSAIAVDGLGDPAVPWPADGPECTDAELSPPGPEDACYVLYTSGSTGTPKGVVQEHRCLANLVTWQRAESVCGPGDRTAQFAPISFDVAFQEIFATLGSGGTLVCLDDAVRGDPGRLWKELERHRVARLFLPFVALETLTLFGEALPVERAALREVVTAGEQLKCTASVRDFFRRLGSCALVNQYGPTETHVVTSRRLEGDPSRWPTLPPIGAPVAGARLYVLDERMRPVAPGQVGELWVGGVPVARGYWGRPEATAQRFLREPGRGPGAGPARAYGTGDLVRVAPGGVLDFVGRRDEQVKVRGIRIEPAEIEAVITEFPGVRSAAVVTHGSTASQKILVAHVVGVRSAEQLTALRDHVARRLPSAMVPSRFEPSERLPLTPSGKVDRLALSGGERR